ncbi:MAG: hypothetical protein R3B41_02235 [Candidatus Doudnabacteria bacterium]
MSKKKRKQFKQPNRAPQSSVNSQTGAPSTIINAVSSASNLPQSTQTSSITNTVYQAHQEEYDLISKDLIRVIVVNGLFFVALVVLYYYNQSHPFLQDIYQKLF